MLNDARHASLKLCLQGGQGVDSKVQESMHLLQGSLMIEGGLAPEQETGYPAAESEQP